MSETTKVYVAFFWHQHQPYYTDDATGETSMPWVRLHGVKDYIGMIDILEKCPGMKMTVNLVPSLLKQIIDQTDNGLQDRFMRLSRKNAEDLADDEKAFILDQFFQANRQHMINPLPRYRALLIKREKTRDNHNPLKSFRDQDFRDLQVLFNMAWIHPLEIRKDEGLQNIEKKGQHFTEEEKHYVLDKHLEILRQIIPAHRRAMESGQVELTTTPFYHPILPLLVDMNCAKRCMPGVRLPFTQTDNRRYAVEQVRRAVEYHEKLFGRKPRGMWPAEGSVSADILPILAEAGIEWIATDEEILAHSIGKTVQRDGMGHVLNPDMLYRPYVAEGGDAQMRMFFRDHYLSDLIGFQYSANDTNSAVADFEARLRKIVAASTGGPLFVSVILDGENAWEYYPNQGIDFLTGLFRRVVEMDGVAPITFSEYLDMNPETGRIDDLYPGSWINHDFYIWIGDSEDVEGWERLNRAKEFYEQRKAQGDLDAATIARIEEELLIAQGSDWYWWFGHDHSSANDLEFDLQFRLHLKNIYQLLGAEPPENLDVPIKRTAASELFVPPRTMLNIRMDGRVTSFFEWLGAGLYSAEDEQGAMNKVVENVLREVHFGFDDTSLFVRVDMARHTLEVMREGHSVRLNFIYPHQGWVDVALDEQGQCVVSLGNGFAAAGVAVEAAADSILEIAMPFGMFGLAGDQAVNFFVELRKGENVVEKAPTSGPIIVNSPSEEYDTSVW